MTTPREPRRQPQRASAFALLPLARAGGTDDPGGALEALWGPRAAEHLLNRAAFGAPKDEVARWAQAGPGALVEHLLDPGELPEPFFVEPLDVDRAALRRLDRDERRRALIRARTRDRDQLRAYTAWWMGELVAGVAPLRERMTLFWHGFFPSTMTKVKRSESMIRQNELFREHALGSYAELLHGILRDPAMLVYLDAGSNRKARPNENLARETMELFSLGEGHYTEKDVREAARALTGRSVDGHGAYVFFEKRHDHGRKRILGKRGRHDGDGFADLLLAREECARHVAGRLLVHFEGVEPDAERLASYAGTLRDHDYRLEPFLRRLFLDPAFYRDEIVGARVGSPFDYLVGASRRLGLDPPGIALARAGEILGQELFEPPSVAGWDEGEHWITTATLMDRGNLVGLLLGVLAIEPEDVLPEPEPSMEPAMAMASTDGGDERGTMEEATGAMAMASMEESGMDRAGEGPDASRVERLAHLLDKLNYVPRLNLTARLARRGATSDVRIADELLEDLLAIEPPPETRAWLVAELGRARAERGIEEGALLGTGAEAEHVLRTLAHRLLALPEGQLH